MKRCLLLFVGGLVAAQIPVVDDGERSLLRGKELFLQGEFEGATASLNEAISLLTDSDQRLDARLTLALIYQTQGNDGRVVRELQWALVEKADLSLDPNLYSPQTQRLFEQARNGATERLLTAKQDFAEGRLSSAKEGFQLAAALLLRGDDASQADLVLDAYLSSALILQTEGDQEGARQSFRRALRLRPGLELDTDFYSPSTVALFREVKNEGQSVVEAIRRAISTSRPEEALRLLGTSTDVFLGPAQNREKNLLEAYARFLTNDREEASRKLEQVITQQPGLTLAPEFYGADFRSLAGNIKLVVTRGLPRIGILQSSDAVVHELARNGFEQATIAQHESFVLPADENRFRTTASQLDLIYVLGDDALALANDCCASHPIIASNLATETPELGSGGPRGGVLWTASLPAQVVVAVRSLPGLSRVGTLSGSDRGEDLVKELQIALATQGITLVSRTIDPGRDPMDALDAVIDSVDLFWYLPDPALASVDTFRKVRARCDRAQKPIFAFHESLVRAGAFVGVSADFTSLGSRAGRMALEYLGSRDRRALELVPGDASQVVLSLATAARLGLKPDPNLVSLAAAVYR